MSFHSSLLLPVLCPAGTHGALPQEPELVGGLPELFIELLHAEVTQVVLPQVQLSQAGVVIEHGGQVLAASRCEATSDQPAGLICMGASSLFTRPSPRCKWGLVSLSTTCVLLGSFVTSKEDKDMSGCSNLGDFNFLLQLRSH